MAVAGPGKIAGLLDSVAAGTLRVPVARIYPLAAAIQAVADLGRHKQR